jgi:solute carrier family 1 (high affinity glutamate transporter) protein 2
MNKNLYTPEKLKAVTDIKKHTLLILTFLGVVIGCSLGFVLRSAQLSPDTIMLIAFPGDLLMRMLKMLVLPLVVSSLVTGVAVLDPKSSGKIGLYAITYYLITTILAAILGAIKLYFKI